MTGLRRRAWEILESAEGGDVQSRRFDLFLFALITLNVLAVIIETVEPVRARAPWFFWWFEVFSVAVFTVEYISRLWAAPEDQRFAHPVAGRLRFAFTPLALVDLFAVLPFYLPFLGIDLRFVRVLRLLRVFRLAKLSRYLGVIGLFRAVLRAKREELIMTSFVLVLLLLIAASFMYYVENAAQPEQFSSIPAAMWWAVATLTTVGYGDVTPITPLGRLLGSVVAVLGIGLFALPTAILGSGFVEEFERRRRPADEAALAAEKPTFCPHCGNELP